LPSSDPGERYLWAVIKAIVFVCLWIAVAAVMLFEVTPFLWGSRSNLGLVGAVVVGVGSVIGLIVGGYFMYRNVEKTLVPHKDARIYHIDQNR